MYVTQTVTSTRAIPVTCTDLARDPYWPPFSNERKSTQPMHMMLLFKLEWPKCTFRSGQIRVDLLGLLHPYPREEEKFQNMRWIQCRLSQSCKLGFHCGSLSIRGFSEPLTWVAIAGWSSCFGQQIGWKHLSLSTYLPPLFLLLLPRSGLQKRRGSQRGKECGGEFWVRTLEGGRCQGWHITG